jgi:transposase
VVGADTAGNVTQRAGFCRDKLAFFEHAERALVGLEPCPGSQWLARKLQAMRHSVRIIPVQFVKPYVMSNKSDTIEAKATAEAVDAVVQVKAPDEVDLQALHRIREISWLLVAPVDLPNACILPRIRRRDPPGRGRL